MKTVEHHEWEILNTPALPKSPNWDRVSNQDRKLILVHGIFNEGFPRCSSIDNRRFEIITSDGHQHIASIDFTNQYFSDWKLWIISSSDTRTIWDTVSKYFVAAWREIVESWDKK
jgi:hypothetical protein